MSAAASSFATSNNRQANEGRPHMAAKHSSARPSYLRGLVGLVLVVGILYLAKAVLVPLALAVLLTFVLNPIVSLVQRRGLGRVPAVLATVILTFAVCGTIGWGVGMQVNKLAQELPDNKEKIQKKIADLRGAGGGPVPRLLQMIREIAQDPNKGDPANNEAPPDKSQVVVARPEEPSSLGRLIHTVIPVLEPVAIAGLVTILVVFMLVKREDLRNRLIGLLGNGTLTGTTRVLVDSAERLSRFLLNQLLVNVSFGILFGLGLLVIGVPYAFLWGFLTAVLRFVPYVGTWISVAFPLLLSFAVSDGWAQPVIVLVFFAVLDLVTANAVEPLVLGHSTGVTPIALLVAAAFWAWIWGPIGLVLATPLTVCLVVLGQHVPRLQFLALLLGDRPPLEPHLSYYQRLLSRDQKEALDVATGHAIAHGLENVYDDVLLPALTLSRRDRKHAGLTADDERFILHSTKEVLDQLEATPVVVREIEGRVSAPDPMATGNPATTVLILGSPAHHESEELSLHMLDRLLRPHGCQLEVLSTRTLPAEVEARVERDRPAVVFIAVLPPGGLVQTRYLCKRLRKRFADVPVVIGCWGAERGFDRLLVRLRSAGANYLTTSLLQSRSQILALVRTAPPTSAQEAEPDLQAAGSR
jgi:predicted PurR-regulated permease PerM